MHAEEGTFLSRIPSLSRAPSKQRRAGTDSQVLKVVKLKEPSIFDIDDE